MQNQNNPPIQMSIPIAIIVAGIMVAGAIVYIGAESADNSATVDGVKNEKGATIKLAAITKNDHFLGDPASPLVIVEFSDLECPFCKNFHLTMKRIMEEYGKDGKVSWVYRHFPLDSIHPKARKEAEATECAALLGEQLAFWEYTDKIFEMTPSNNGLDLAILPDIAEEIGLNRAEFEECLSSGKTKDAVNEDIKEALDAGAKGTPYSVLLMRDGTTIPFFGAEPYESVKQKIDDALENINKR